MRIGNLWKECNVVKEVGDGAEPQAVRGKKGRKTALSEEIEQQILKYIKVKTPGPI